MNNINNHLKTCPACGLADMKSEFKIVYFDNNQASDICIDCINKKPIHELKRYSFELLSL